MSEFVGVLSLLSSPTNLKREAIMFRRLAIPELSVLLAFSEISPYRNTDALNDLHWLIEQQIVFEPEEYQEETSPLDIEEYREYLALENEHLEESENVWLNEQVHIMKRLRQSADHRDKALEYYIRRLCVQMRFRSNIDAHPILRQDLHELADSITRKGDVTQVVINALPVPDDLTPWEYILEFKKDPDSESKFANIRNWINEVAREQVPRNEIEDRIQSALADYQAHMTMHGIKINLGTLKTFVVTEAGLLAEASMLGVAGLLGLGGMLATPLFLLKQRKVNLLEAELNAPGKELAYIIKARETFI